MTAVGEAYDDIKEVEVGVRGLMRMNERKVVLNDGGICAFV